jgi:hypothetical protein
VHLRGDGVDTVELGGGPGRADGEAAAHVATCCNICGRAGKQRPGQGRPRAGPIRAQCRPRWIFFAVWVV